jgi:hypothetical protein
MMIRDDIYLLKRFSCVVPFGLGNDKRRIGVVVDDEEIVNWIDQ